MSESEEEPRHVYTWNVDQQRLSEIRERWATTIESEATEHDDVHVHAVEDIRYLLRCYDSEVKWRKEAMRALEGQVNAKCDALVEVNRLTRDGIALTIVMWLLDGLPGVPMRSEDA